MPFFFFSWEIKVNNSKVVEYSKGFLGITVNLPSDDWPLKFWPLNLYFNPIARDMAQNDAVFFLFILERSQEEQICRRLCGLSRINSKFGRWSKTCWKMGSQLCHKSQNFKSRFAALRRPLIKKLCKYKIIANVWMSHSKKF